MGLSLNLQAFVSQRLITNKAGGRRAANEVMLGSLIMGELVLRGDIGALRDIIEKSKDCGTKSFDTALLDLCQAGIIAAEDASRDADSQNNLRLKLRLASDPVPDRLSLGF